MPVLMAQHGGFCFGVQRAVDAVERAIAEGLAPLYTWGEIIHNRAVVDDLARRGVTAAHDLGVIPPSGTVIVRAHGAGPQLAALAEERGLDLIDATCPFVRRVQTLADTHSQQGRAIVVIGQAVHPEVRGICDWSHGRAIVVEPTSDGGWRCIAVRAPASIDPLTAAYPPPCCDDDFQNFDDFDFPRSAAVVAQTTLQPSTFQAAVKLLRKKVNDLCIFDTICETTALRQKEAEELAKRSETVLVLGSKHSSNTQKLLSIAKRYCENAFIIENHVDSALEKIHVSDIISIIAGASTPNWMMMEVLTRMSELEKTTVDVTEEAVAVDTVETQTGVAETAADSSVDTEMAADSSADSDFMAALDKTFVRVRSGQVMTGTIVQVTETEVSVNIGYKSDGYIPKAEFSSDPDVNIADVVKVGDSIEVEVIKVNDAEGNVLLSHKSVEARKAWDAFVDHAEEEGAVFDATGREVVKGGLIAYIEGVRTFIPASQVSNRYVENLSEFVGQPLRLKILEVDRNKRRVVASQKAVLIAEAADRKRDIWNALEVGQRCKGIVRRLTDFGAFVDIGGIDGLVHVTEMAWGRVKHPKDVFKEGDEIEVVIKGLDPERERISLGYKELLPDPWDEAAEKYPVGSIIEGKVVRIKPFGAFVALEPRIDGLVHISQVATKRIEKVEDELKIGDVIRSKVLSVDTDAKRISLSRREVLLEEESLEDMLTPDLADEADDGTAMFIDTTETATTSLGDLFPSFDAHAAASEEVVEEAGEVPERIEETVVDGVICVDEAIDDGIENE